MYVKDRDHMHRGIGAIAAVDARSRRRQWGRRERARLLERRDARAVAEMALGGPVTAPGGNGARTGKQVPTKVTQIARGTMAAIQPTRSTGTRTLPTGFTQPISPEVGTKIADPSSWRRPRAPTSTEPLLPEPGSPKPSATTKAAYTPSASVTTTWQPPKDALPEMDLLQPTELEIDTMEIELAPTPTPAPKRAVSTKTMLWVGGGIALLYYLTRKD